MSRWFDGSDDQVTIAKAQSLGNASLFICFKLDKAVDAGSTMVLYDHRGSNGRGNAIFINSGLVVRFGYSSSVQRNEDLNFPGTINAGVWYRVAAAFSPVGADGSGVLYVDGNLQDSTVARNVPGGTTAQNTIHIGANISGAAVSATTGEIAHLLWWKRRLGNGELIQTTFYPGSITEGLQLYFPLHGVSSPEPEYSGKALVGTLGGPLQGPTNPPINGMFTIPRPELMRSF